MKEPKKWIGLITMLSMLLIGAGSTFALGPYYWIGTVNNNWSNAGNWSLASGGGAAAAPPVAGEIAIVDIGSGANRTISVDAGIAGAGVTIQITNVTGPVGISVDAALMLSAGTSIDMTAASDNLTITGGAGAITLAGAAVFDVVVGRLLTISETIDNGTNLLTVQGAGNTSISGAISNTGGLTKTGAGTLTLSAGNTYSGMTIVTTGNLTLIGPERIDDTSDVTMGAAGVLTLGGAEKINTLTGLGGASIVLGANTLTVDQDGAATFDGVISGTGGLTLDANSTNILSLGGTNTYSGTTTINANGIATTAAGVIDDTSDLTLAAAGKLFLGGAEKVNTLTGAAGSTINNLGFLFTVDQDASTTFAGVISGGGGLTIDVGSSNDLILSGVNTYTGATTVNARTLTFNGVNTGVSAVTANNAGTKIAGIGTIPGAVTMNAGTILAPGTTNGDDVGTLTITGLLTFNGASKYVVTITGGLVDRTIAGNDVVATVNVPTLELQAGYNTAGVLVPVTTLAITGAYTAFNTSTLPVGFVIDGAKVLGDIRFTAMPGVALVPTLNEWGIILTLLLLAGVGVTLIRRQRRIGNCA